MGKHEEFDAPPIDNVTVAYVRARVDQIIRHAPDDDEAAHLLEDRLHIDVLRAFAAGAPDAPALAAAALATLAVEFARWCS